MKSTLTKESIERSQRYSNLCSQLRDQMGLTGIELMFAIAIQADAARNAWPETWAAVKQWLAEKVPNYMGG